MFKAWAASWESYMNTLSRIQEEGEKMLNIFFTQSDKTQEETKNLVKEGIANLRKAHKSYARAVEENLRKIEELFTKA